MLTCGTKAAMRDAVRGWRDRRASIGLVPTMGGLHAGHMALVAGMRRRTDRTVASLFVNPTQFGSPNDLAAYPRTMERDLEMLAAAGVDAVFVPGPDEMYHPEAHVVVEPAALSGILMGALRPGHFRGVATVVTKLLMIVQPDRAAFGEKDWQQLAVIRALVRDLDIPVAIDGVPTVRDADGLALSSRNVRLTPADRAAAPVLHRALRAAQAALAAGAAAEAAESRMPDVVAAEPRARLASADVRDAATLAPVHGRPTRDSVLLIAAHFGDVLLIDQMVAAVREAET